MSILIKIIKLSVKFLLVSLIVSQSVKANIAGSALVDTPTSFNYVYQSGKFIISWRWGIHGGGDEAFSVTTDQISAINYSSFPSPVCPGGCSNNEVSAFEISVSEDNASYRFLATVTDTRNYEFTPTNHSSFQFRIRVKQSSFSGSVYYSDYLYSPIFNYVGAVIVPKVDSVKVYPAGQYLVDGTKVSLQSDQTNEIYFKVSNEFDSCSSTDGWQLYSLPFALGYSAKICTSAKKQGWLDSDITSHSYTVLEQLAYPLMTPSGGTISSSSKITLNNTQYEKTGLYIQQRVYGAGVVQYKILNYQQSCDISFWRTYITPFKLNGSSRVCARVILAGQFSSSVSYKDFNLKFKLTSPAISPNGGNYSTNTQFSISNPQSAVIKYKTVPLNTVCSDTNWLNYSAAVTLTSSRRVCYKATKSNWTDSDIRYADFAFKLNKPSISPAVSDLIAGSSITLSANNDGANVLYKRVSHGTSCTSGAWSNYSTPVVLSSDTRLCVKTTAIDWAESDIVVNDYRIQQSEYADISNNSLADSAFSSVDVPLVESVGTIAGQAGVSGGAATYHIPIMLPPGRAGMQPEVSLNYSSRSGNGIAGVGWSLSAGSSITRCAATYAQDGFTQNPQYSNNDRLCLDGQRLMATSGIYGNSGTEYRTEIDSFTRVTQSGSLNGTSTWFKAEYKNGRVAYFGKTADSKVVHVGKSAAYSWLIEYQHDATAKNYIHYEYEGFAVGEKLLKKISYTGTNETLKGQRNVKFSYSPKSYPKHGYVANGKFEVTQRLEKVSSFIGDVKLNEYNLKFSTSRVTGRDLLLDVELCKSNNSCLPTLNLSWANEALTVNNESMPIPATLSINSVTPNADRNGDGSRDWPGYYTNAESELTENSHPSTGCSFAGISGATVNCYMTSIDINLDGYTDNIHLSPINNIRRLTFIKNEKAGAISAVNTDIVVPSLSSIIFAGDLNGDSFPDIVINEHTVDTVSDYVNVYFHTTNPASPYTKDSMKTLFRINKAGSGSSFDSPLFSVVYAGDLDGNGLGDFYKVSNTISSKGRLVSLHFVSNSTQYDLSMRTVTIDWGLNEHPNNWEHFFVFADVNGDGLRDWLGWHKPDLNSTNLFVRYNRGGTFTEPFSTNYSLNARRFVLSKTYGFEGGREREEIIYTPKYKQSILIADINNNGIEEILIPKIIVDTGCYHVPHYQGSSQICGNDIYTAEIESLRNVYSSIDAKHDHSIYRYEAIMFSKDAVTAQLTDFYGSASHTKMIDAQGDGLPDMVFNYGCESGPLGSACSYLGSTPSGFRRGYVNISRNYGAGTGIENKDYLPIDMLLSVENGVGLQSYWEYRPLSSGISTSIDGAIKLYKKGTTYNSGHQNFSSSMYVVKTLSYSDGIGGLRYKDYAYRGAVYNAQGRGFLGFESIIEQDRINQTISQSDFKQEFPFTGKLTRQAIYTASDYAIRGDGLLGEAASESNALSYSHTVWQDNGSHDLTGVYSIYPRTTTEITRDLATKAQLTSTAKNITAIDEYANVTAASTQVSDDWGTYTTAETSTYESDADTWWLNKLTSKTLTKASITNRHSNDPFTNAELDKTTSLTTTYSNYHASRQPQTAVTRSQLAGASSGYGSTITTAYNTYGLPTSVSQTTKVRNSSGSWVNQTRTNSTTYSKNGTSAASDGYFPYKQTNAKGHISYTHVNPATGQVTQTRQQLSGNNYQITNFTYDDYSRPYSVQTAGMPIQYTAVQAVDEQAPDHAVLQVLQVAAGQPTQKTYQDKLGRTLRTAVQGFNGHWLFADVTYNNVGYKTFESVPYEEHSTVFGSSYSYDVLGRVTNKMTNQHCGDMTTDYDYNGLTTNLTVSEDCYGITLDMSRTYNSLKQLMQTVDADNGVTRYSYNNQGLPIVIQDANGNDIVAKYNALGQKTQVNDPNQGVTNFEYNGFGELQREARVGSKTLTYVTDVLGRVTRRTATGESTLNYTYDGATYGLGQLNQATGNGVTKTYSYDNRGRPSGQTIAGSGKSYTTTTFYDSSYGRVKGLRYPNNLTLEYNYNDAGYQTQVKNAASGYVYKTISEHDAFGNVTQSTLGNGLSESTAYSLKNGQMTLKTIAKNSSNIMNIDYSAYDGFGNLKAVDITTGNIGNQHSFSETYSYDALHRLESNAVNGITTINYSYDAVGNLLSKSDYATQYDYTNGATGGPNAVKRVYRSGGWKTFSYDARGNMTKGDGLTSASYNAMDKPTQIKKDGKTLNFTYGPEHMRFKQVNDNVTIYYSDKLYEEEFDGTNTTWRAYIDDIAVISQTTGEGATIRYTHRDRLGSARVFTDHNGQVEAERNFDPFGKPRLASGGLKPYGNSKLDDLDNAKTRRGFTDHEHLDNVELIHMNGRVYDYNLGRFMSVDPIIQSVGNSQSINPYSYIMNNPLSGTDPTGYTAECNDSGVCDIGNIKMDDVENVQVTKDGNMVVNTKDGNSYQVESINGADAKGAFTSAYNVGKSPDIMSQSNINKSSPTPSGGQSSGGCGGALSASVAVCGVLPPPPVAGMSDVTGQADRNKRMAEGLTDLSNDLAEQKKLVLKAVQMALSEFRRPNSEVLKNTLAKAGMQKPDGNWDAHHIVFWGHSHVDSKAARDLLEEFGIDINSADNLVWLPRTQHDKRQLGVPHLAHHGDGIHTYRAISSVNQRLNMAVDKNHARAILRSIRNDLERGHKFWETQ